VFFDQVELPGAAPFFKALFAQNGVFQAVIQFKMHELPDIVTLGEALIRASAMLPDAGAQIGGDADVKRAVAVAGKDIDAGLFHRRRIAGFGQMTELLVMPMGGFGCGGGGLGTKDWIPAFAGMTALGMGFRHIRHSRESGSPSC